MIVLLFDGVGAGVVWGEGEVATRGACARQRQQNNNPTTTTPNNNNITQGKTLVFGMPLVMIALQEEMRMPLLRDEGPSGLIICPSRELAGQTAEVLEGYCAALRSVSVVVRGFRFIACALLFVVRRRACVMMMPSRLFSSSPKAPKNSNKKPTTKKLKTNKQTN